VSLGAPVVEGGDGEGRDDGERYTIPITQINAATYHERDVNIYKRWVQ